MKFSDISRDKTITFGLTMTMISIIIAYLKDTRSILLLSLAIVIMCIASPVLLKPFAFVFYNIVKVIGKLLSSIVLGLVFFIIITPIAIFRRLLGHDTMKMDLWKKDTNSVFTDCDHVYSASDLEKTF